MMIGRGEPKILATLRKKSIGVGVRVKVAPGTR